MPPASALSAMLRPGNARANDVGGPPGGARRAIAQLPERVAAGHRAGDDATRSAATWWCGPTRPGAPSDFVWGCRAATSASVSRLGRTPRSTGPSPTIAGLDEALEAGPRQDGDLTPRAAVIELTDLVDLSSVPHGHPPHRPPGAAASRCPAEPVPVLRLPLLGPLHRPGRRPGRPRLLHAGPCPRRRPHRALEGLGLAALSLRRPRGQPGVARWSCPRGRPRALVPAPLPRRPVGRVRPKALRWSVLPCAGSPRASGRVAIVRVLEGWPNAEAILGAHRRIALIT